MVESKKVGLFITRAQPGMHFGQVDGIKQAMEKGITHFLIGIGSSNKEYTKENPFLYDERKKMLELSCKHIEGAQFQILFLPDFEHDEDWKNYILTKLPHFDYVVTGNPWVRDIFSSVNKKLIWLKIRKNIKGTFLRDQLALGRVGELKKSLFPNVVTYLKKIDAEARLMEIFQNEHESPHLTVDVIFKDHNGHIILIDRNSYPNGVALPGGFVNYGEKPEDAIIREIKEETGAIIKIKGLIAVYGDADRDPRAHIVSIIYEGEYVSGVIKAADDTKKIVRIKTKDDLGKINFCFDHKKILKEYFRNVKSNKL